MSRKSRELIHPSTKKKVDIPAFNYDMMRKIYKMPMQQFSKIGFKKKQYKDRKTNTLQRTMFKDNGSNILGVAHLDSHYPPAHFVVANLSHKRIILSPVHDDRIGAYLMIDMLPRMGINVDILLTEDEEQGNSSAKHFTPKKEYKWIFMFDRSGTDVALYQYNDADLRAKLKKHGLEGSHGSYSCIKDMEKLGVKGMNFGSCYYNNHSLDSYLNESELAINLACFRDFYNEFKDTKLEHKEPEYKSYQKWQAPDWYAQRYYGSVQPVEREYVEPTGTDYKDWSFYHDFFCQSCGKFTQNTQLELFMHELPIVEELFDDSDGLEMCYRCYLDQYRTDIDECLTALDSDGTEGAEAEDDYVKSENEALPKPVDLVEVSK